MTVRVPAKINLVLAVGAKRSDGYHELATVFQAISLYDEVEARAAAEISVAIQGEYADQVPTGESNLAVRAAATLAGYAGVRSGVRLRLRKRIPVAGGLAGGSADAAGSLVACDALWETGLGRAELSSLAGRLGSDVPFALAGGTALGAGRGERLTPVMVGGTFHWVVAVAAGGLSTPAVYAELDRLRAAGEGTDSDLDVGFDVLTALRAGNAEALAAALRNDLEAAARTLLPGLRTTLETGRELGALAGIVSGSGPSCAFLARDAEHAGELADELVAAQVCADALVATGPVPGARLI
ncbi:MAG TPA: 4-(cytidine 5'-diphospho)-2-C-methyl-D-erythritol kinase [Jiangellaceae bacterium]|nr:4-(cytidine 5'-diphospho)-2-C-methyl-D-erythritol kinase [Jiangellaceae bacterium]